MKECLNTKIHSIDRYEIKNKKPIKLTNDPIDRLSFYIQWVITKKKNTHFKQKRI